MHVRLLPLPEAKGPQILRTLLAQFFPSYNYKFSGNCSLNSHFDVSNLVELDCLEVIIVSALSVDKHVHTEFIDHLEIHAQSTNDLENQKEEVHL